MKRCYWVIFGEISEHEAEFLIISGTYLIFGFFDNTSETYRVNPPSRNS